MLSIRAVVCDLCIVSCFRYEHHFQMRYQLLLVNFAPTLCDDTPMTSTISFRMIQSLVIPFTCLVCVTLNGHTSTAIRGLPELSNSGSRPAKREGDFTNNSAAFRLVRPPGIEPGYAASETTILSVELRALDSGRCFAWALEGGKSFSGRCRCA